EWVLKRFQLQYLTALSRGELANANAALKEIAKLVGAYVLHNEQRQYTDKDLHEAKRRLEEAGMDFTRWNYPVEKMTDVQKAEQKAALERRKAEAERRLKELDAARVPTTDRLTPGAN